MLAAADYDALRAEQASRRSANDPIALGIGIAVYVEITAGAPGSEFGAVELLEGGRLRVRTGTTPFGQGHDTTWAMVVAERTGVPIENIEVIHGDTDQVRSGGLTVGSRSVQIGGAAIDTASGTLVDLARERAADVLECAVDDVVLDIDRSVFHVAGTPAKVVDWAQLAASEGEALQAECDFTPVMPTFPFGAHLAVVEVDTETGDTRLRRLVAVDDAGKILNPLLAEGQVHGGIAQGVAQALFEAVRYSDDGQPQTTNFADYLVISADRAALVRGRAHGDAHVRQPARRQGSRRVRHDRCDPGGVQRGDRRRRASRHPPPRDAAHARVPLDGITKRSLRYAPTNDTGVIDLSTQSSTKPSKGGAVSHLVLNVRDIEASHHFYTELLGFEQCAELKHTMVMRFYRGNESHHHDFALGAGERPRLDGCARPVVDGAQARGCEPHRHRLPRPRDLAERARALEGERRRVHRARQPRHDALRLHRRSRRLRHRGALRRALRDVVVATSMRR